MIQFDHVSKTYPNGYQALKDVNLTINDGDFVCIIGLSGAGKSTLIRTINKMHPVTEGKLLVQGEDIGEANGKKLRVASLDPVTTISVMDDFARINREGITIVANMHHVDLAVKYATRIIGIRAGEVVFDGPKEEVTDEVLMQIYGRALKREENLGVADAK